VLRLAARGLPQGAIATALDLSPNTVKTHLRRAAEKLGVASRAESLEVAAARGLVPADDPRRRPARTSALAEILRLAAEQGLLPKPFRPR
jgi:hypothetical protein